MSDEMTINEWAREVRRLENLAADFSTHDRMVAAREMLSGAVEVMRLVAADFEVAPKVAAKLPAEKPLAVRKRPAKAQAKAQSEPEPEVVEIKESDEDEAPASNDAPLRPLKRNNEWMRTLSVRLEERGIGAELTSHDLQAWGESTMQVASQRAKRLLDAGVLERLGRGSFRVVRYPELG